MPIKLTPRGDGSGVFWDTGRGVQRIEYRDIPGRPGSAQHQARLQTELQARLDVRQRLDSLPGDDPDRIINPNRNTLHWGRSDGTRDDTVTLATDGYLVSRVITVEIIAWDGADYAWRTSRVL